MAKKKPKPTGIRVIAKKCPHCDGTGHVNCNRLDGWYIRYRYQDGSEDSGPYSEAEAIGHMKNNRLGHNATLIGPDGQAYTL